MQKENNHYEQIAIECTEEDGQMFRSIDTMLCNLFEAFNGRTFSFEGVAFNDEIEFYKYLKYCIESSIELIEQIRLDEQTA